MENENVASTSEITPNDNPNNSVKHYKPLDDAVCRGDWEAANDFLKEHPEGITSRIDDLGSTALHIAAGFGHLHIVRKLVKSMPEKYLELENNERVVPFFRAIDTGIVEMAQCMIEKNPNLVKIPNVHNLLPVTYAVIVGQLEMARYLYLISSEELLPEKGDYGVTLLGECFECGNVDLALDLLQRCPSLALIPNKEKNTFVWLLACKPFVFKSGCQLLFWQRWIYNWIQIESASVVKDTWRNSTESNESDDIMNKRPCLLHQLIENISILVRMPTVKLRNLIGVERIYQSKLTHELSLELLRLTCEQIATLHTDSQLKKASVFLNKEGC